MDKRSPKISIKVNGAKTDYKEEKRSDGQGEFQWVLPAEQAALQNVVPFRAEEEREKQQEKEKKKGKRAIVLTIGTAVLLGTGFGFGVLNILSDTKTEQTTAAVQEQTQTKAEEAKTEEKTEAVQQTTNAAALQGLTIYVVQGNVFSTEERGQAALADMKKKGLPGTLFTSDGKTLVWIGALSNEAGAKKLAAAYKEKGFSALVKQRAVTGKLSEDLKDQEKLLGQAETALQTLMEQSSAMYTEGNIEAAKWKELGGQIDALVKAEKGVKQEDVKKLITYLSVSYDALGEYKESKKETAFVKLQQILLDGFVAYETIVSGKSS